MIVQYLNRVKESTQSGEYGSLHHHLTADHIDDILGDIQVRGFCDILECQRYTIPLWRSRWY